MTNPPTKQAEPQPQEKPPEEGVPRVPHGNEPKAAPEEPTPHKRPAEAPHEDKGPAPEDPLHN